MPAPPSPATRPTCASSNRPPRSASSACTPPSWTTRSSAPPAPCPRRSAYAPAPAPTSCAPSSKAPHVSELPAGWGAPSHASAAAAARTGLRVSADHLIQLFDTPLLAQTGLIEARVVRKALRAAADGEPLPLDGLADLVSLELWLRRLIARRGTCWTGTPARQRAVPTGSVAPQRGALGAGR